ncbi:MAG: hypothetical protein M3024_12715, partial [Candidatus Dormibacteraeota bacterium]|nr:hypothetical protein [Candidatus Dormibacteraeota bacterium]
EDPDDDGRRALFVKGNMRDAVAAAVRAAGARGLEVEGELQVQYVGDGKPSKPGLAPPKLYEARYRRPAADPVPVPEGTPPSPNGRAAEAAGQVPIGEEIPF